MPTPIGHALGGAIVALALMPEAACSALARLRVRGSAAAGAPPPAAAGGPPFGGPSPRDAERPSPRSGGAANLQPRSGEPAAAEPRTFLLLSAVAACLPDLDFFWGRHNMETHSVGFALLIALAVFAWRRDARLALTCLLAVGSHILFDWLGSDDSPPIGVMAWWPFSNGFYFANLFVFDAISRRYWLPGFVRHNVLAVLREIAILLPIAAVLWIWRRRQAHAHVHVQGSGIREQGSARNRQ